MTYDLIVIGSGPGGYSAAVRAGQYGLKTAIVEKDPKLGGTCLHVGCIPTKALLHTADVWEHFVNPGDEGIQCENPRLDYAKVLDRKNKIVSKHAKGVEFLMKKNKVDWVKGYGTILPRSGSGPLQVEVKSETGAQTLETKNVIIATGSEARMLPGLEPDEKAILTNIEILDLPVIPKTMLIIGAGAVGVEFASIFNRFGTKVTVLEMLPRLVPVEDEEVSKELERYFKKTGIRVRNGRQGREHHAHRKWRSAVRRARERQARGHGGRDAAGGRGPQAEYGEHRSRQAEGAAGSRLHQGGRAPAHRRAGRLRDRRRGGWNAAAGARRDDGRHGGGGAHGGQAVQADQSQSHSRMHLHRAGHRQRRTDRGAGARAGIRGEGGQVPVRGQQQGDHSGTCTTAS